MLFIPKLPRQSLPRLGQSLLVLLLMWLLTGVTWQLLAPGQHGRTLRLPQAAPSQKQIDPESVSRLFSQAATDAVAAESNNLSLRALISGRNGVAIIDGVEASAVAVKLGGEVGSYGKLLAAYHDHIVLELNGQQRKIYLNPQGISPNANPTNASAAIPQNNANTANSSSTAIGLTRGQLTGVLQGGNLANWSKGLGTSAAGGISIERASEQQLAQVLQLRDGDVIKAVNGRPLNKLDDISLLYAAFSQQNQLSVQIMRQDQQQTLSYTVNP
ncbi:type II secretion system protein N [Chitinibacter sp. FCG-7]|uniref:Type II secretion system protein N n=1 Tax=Chitinibacter mangrovi TaxID=3153927 RepID=A0AAU7F5X0_9NEIS